MSYQERFHFCRYCWDDSHLFWILSTQLLHFYVLKGKVKQLWWYRAYQRWCLLDRLRIYLCNHRFAPWKYLSSHRLLHILLWGQESTSLRMFSSSFLTIRKDYRILSIHIHWISKFCVWRIHFLSFDWPSFDRLAHILWWFQGKSRYSQSFSICHLAWYEPLPRLPAWLV